MAAIPRKTAKIFASNAGGTGVAVPGSVADGSVVYSTDVATLQSTAFVNGLADMVIAGTKRLEVYEEANGVNLVLSQQIAYLLERGIPEWDSGTEYNITDVVRKTGTYELYGSVGNANTGNALPSAVTNANWTYLGTLSDLGGVVTLNGVQSLTNKTLVDAANVLTVTQGYTNSSAGGTGCSINYYHNSASPAASDTQPITWSFNNASITKIDYGTIRCAVDDVTPGSEDGRLDFQTVVAGSFATRAKITRGLVVGTPTGDDMGIGTINATAVYDDGVLLTCYPIQLYVDGAVDIAYWDDKASVRDGEGNIVEERQHAPARGFVDKMSRVNLLDIDSYISEWKVGKALPAFYGFEADKKPTGESIQRIMETLDIFAIHIDKLNKRIKDLENS